MSLTFKIKARTPCATAESSEPLQRVSPLITPDIHGIKRRGGMLWLLHLSGGYQAATPIIGRSTRMTVCGTSIVIWSDHNRLCHSVTMSNRYLMRRNAEKKRRKNLRFHSMQKKICVSKKCRKKICVFRLVQKKICVLRKCRKKSEFSGSCRKKICVFRKRRFFITCA